MIEVKNISKKIRNQQILDQVSLTIKKQSIAVLEGINGSGKTMLLKAILGLIRTQGEILIEDQVVLPQKSYPVTAGILIENPSLVEHLTASKNIQLITDLQGSVDEKEYKHLFETFSLYNSKDKKVKNFSLGMKQKVGLIQAFIGCPNLIVLDEPTNALDSDSIESLVSLIHEYKEKGCTFIVATHDKNFAQSIADQYFQVREGKVYEKEMDSNH